MATITIGQQVTCKVAIEAYYSGYAGRPKQSFEPGMVGTLAVMGSPNVRESKCEVCSRKHDIGHLVDFAGADMPNVAVNGNTWRVRLSPCNVIAAS